MSEREFPPGRRPPSSELDEFLAQLQQQFAHLRRTLIRGARPVSHGPERHATSGGDA
jgi:hypothetical protein